MNSSISGMKPDPLKGPSEKKGIENFENTSPLDFFSPDEIFEIPSSEIYEGIDRVDSEPILVQEFVTAKNWNDYETHAKNPLLQQPSPEGVIPPYLPYEQAGIKKFYTGQVRDQVFQAMKGDKEPANVAAIPAKKIHEPQNGVEEGSPGKGSPGRGNASLGKEDLAGIAAHVEESVEKRVQAIIQASKEGALEDLDPDDRQIAINATEATQQAWKLPPSWILGSQELSSWTKVQVDSPPPMEMNLLATETLVTNMEQLSIDIQKKANKLLGSFSDDNPNQVPVNDLIIVIGKAIQNLKEVLQRIQGLETKNSNKILQAKQDLADQRADERAEAIKLQKEVESNLKKQQKKHRMVQWLAPTVTAIMLVVGVAALVVSGGASMIFIVAASMVGAGMLAYTTADTQSEKGLTTQVIEAFNRAAVKVAGENNRVGQDLFKAAILTIVAGLMLFMMACSGGALATSAATTVFAAESAGATAGAVITEIIFQATAEASLMFIMASNVIPEALTLALIKSGAIDRHDEQGKMIAQIVFMIAEMMVLMLACARVQGGVAKKYDLKQPTPLKLPEWIAKRVPNIREYASKIQLITQVGGLGIQAGTSITLGLLCMDLADIYRHLGNVESAIEIIQTMIKAYERMMSELQNTVKEENQWYNQLNEALNSVYATGRQIADKATYNFLAS